jgi:hypothetical protein
MKKTLAYMTTAVLLGVVVMFVPLQLLSTARYPADCMLADGRSAEWLQTADLNGGSAAILQLTLLNGGLMLAFSFVFALGVFLYVRKRVV